LSASRLSAPVAARVLPLRRGVDVHRINRTPGAAITCFAGGTILSFALRQLGWHFRVARIEPL